MYEKISKAEKLKLMIIENYIDWFTSDDKERESMKQDAFSYVMEDHCNELEDLVSNKRTSENW
jgi:hypothetical protein